MRRTISEPKLPTAPMIRICALRWRRCVQDAFRAFLGFSVAIGLALVGTAEEPPHVDGNGLLPTSQRIRPAGDSLEFGGRPVDLVLTRDGRTLAVKDNRGIVLIDVPSWTIREELPFPKGGGSMHGIAATTDGRRIYATTAGNELWELAIAEDGSAEWARSIELPGPGGKGAAHATGIALASDDRTAYVALSRTNAIAVVDLDAGRVRGTIPVGVAPYGVLLSPDGTTAYVTNWGGRHPGEGDRTGTSSGTPVVVDERGIAASGTVSIVDLEAGKAVAEIDVGLHPAGLALDPTRNRLYVANANSDTVSVLDTATRTVIETILVRPDRTLPFGSATNAVALSSDGRTLFAANGGNNAIAVVALGDGPRASAVTGFIPTGWYPGGIVTDGRTLYIANVKGRGSRNPHPDKRGWHVYWYLGTVQKVAIPDAETLAAYTAQVREDARVPQILRAWERSTVEAEPVPVPERLGDPSVFEHVVYIVKENRTYDQLFGDLPQGNGDPELTIFGREVTPNHHALAEQFVLLDNFYLNGVNSADGHSWVTEGNVTDHLEKSFGGFTRSYTWGNDALNYSSSGFIWDNVLLHGLSFWNFGEFDYANTDPPSATFETIYRDYVEGKGEIRFTHNIGLEPLRRYSEPDYPGWNMKIPDVLRADVFIDALGRFESEGSFPNLVFLYLPNDHTSGTSPGYPTPRAQVADNDLALGRVVEAITQSRFWEKTVIFVIEDDPQAGFDHVDGHRSICLVISPYTKRGAVVSEFYNQTSVLHTIERILGIPPMNQMDALAPLMTAVFTETPDFTPYTALPNNIPLDEMNPEVGMLEGAEREWALRSLEQPFDRFDEADEDVLNRILWHAVKGTETPYPEHFAGAHGSGLAELGLELVPEEEDD